MKQSTTLLSTLLVLSLPGTVQAACDSYMNSTHELRLPATITVPDSLPVGAEITRTAFSGVVPGRFMNCATSTLVSIYGRYNGMQTPTPPYAWCRRRHPYHDHRCPPIDQPLCVHKR